MENETDEQNPTFSTIQLMGEVMTAESKHKSSLAEALNEMQTSLDVAQSEMTTPKELSKNYRQVAGIVHSVKGLAQSFELPTIAKALHELEDVLGDVVSSGQNSVAMEKLVESFKTLLSLIIISKSFCSEEKTLDFG
ncbi:Hpt domain-containing protein [bacterium]|nr:Hpt domain-containing protein [bacterium]